MLTNIYEDNRSLNPLVKKLHKKPPDFLNRRLEIKNIGVAFKRIFYYVLVFF